MISVDCASKKLHVKTKHVYYLIAVGELSGLKVRWVWRLWEKEVDEYGICRAERGAGKTASVDSQSDGYLFYFGGISGHNLSGDKGQKTTCLQSRRRVERTKSRFYGVHGKNLNNLTQLSLFDTIQ